VKKLTKTTTKRKTAPKAGQSWIKRYAERHHLIIEESTRPLILHVDKSDVKSGNKKEAQSCAFAVCAKREIPGVKKSFFFRSVAYLQFKDKIVRYTLPVSVMKEIVSFDRSGKIEPGTYQLSPPSPRSTRMAAQARSRKRTGRHQPRGGEIKRKLVHSTTDVRSFSDTASM